MPERPSADRSESTRTPSIARVRRPGDRTRRRRAPTPAECPRRAAVAAMRRGHRAEHVERARLEATSRVGPHKIEVVVVASMGDRRPSRLERAQAIAHPLGDIEDADALRARGATCSRRPSRSRRPNRPGPRAARRGPGSRRHRAARRRRGSAGRARRCRSANRGRTAPSSRRRPSVAARRRAPARTRRSGGRRRHRWGRTRSTCTPSSRRASHG